MLQQYCMYKRFASCAETAKKAPGINTLHQPFAIRLGALLIRLCAPKFPSTPPTHSGFETGPGLFPNGKHEPRTRRERMLVRGEVVRFEER
jgi:hypothetical protein